MKIGNIFHTQNGGVAIIPLPEPYALPQPPKHAEQETVTALGRVRAARRRWERTGQLDGLFECVAEAAIERDARDK
jgi:hypothetical protein